jgi:hypothetical protein
MFCVASGMGFRVDMTRRSTSLPRARIPFRSSRINSKLMTGWSILSRTLSRTVTGNWLLMTVQSFTSCPFLMSHLQRVRGRSESRICLSICDTQNRCYIKLLFLFFKWIIDTVVYNAKSRQWFLEKGHQITATFAPLSLSGMCKVYPDIHTGSNCSMWLLWQTGSWEGRMCEW